MSNIVTTCGENDHAVLSAIKLLEKADIKDEDSITEITNSCKTVKSECEKGLAEKVLATKHNGYDVLIKLAENSTKNENVLMNAISALSTLLVSSYGKLFDLLNRINFSILGI